MSGYYIRKKEYRTLRQIGTLYLQDTTHTLQQNIIEWRQWVREYHCIAEQMEMKLFEEANGFPPSDDDAKRALIDQQCRALNLPVPQTDEERNAFTYSRRTPMMQIGWIPLYQSLKGKK